MAVDEKHENQKPEQCNPRERLETVKIYTMTTPLSLHDPLFSLHDEPILGNGMHNISLPRLHLYPHSPTDFINGIAEVPTGTEATPHH